MRLYSPEKRVLYKKIKKGDDSWTWDRVEEVTEPALKYQNIKDPEVGRHELILKLYEKYADVTVVIDDRTIEQTVNDIIMKK